jgi:hypothetical protein
MAKAKKKAEKKETIQVTARFEVTFYADVTEEQWLEMDADRLKVEDVIDESVAYGHLANDGTCEMEWDYGPAKLKRKAAR